MGTTFFSFWIIPGSTRLTNGTINGHHLCQRLYQPFAETRSDSKNVSRVIGAGCACREAFTVWRLI